MHVWNYFKSSLPVHVVIEYTCYHKPILKKHQSARATVPLYERFYTFHDIFTRGRTKVVRLSTGKPILHSLFKKNHIGRSRLSNIKALSDQSNDLLYDSSRR